MSQSIDTIAELEAHYGNVNPRSITKELDHLADIYRPFIEKAPFCILATSGPDGLDCTPRGDPPGFVRIQDNKTLLLPDRRGNNRLDSLRNIIANPEIALIFLIPGIGETLRVSGTATISLDPELRDSLAIQGKPPSTVLVIAVRKVYFQCQKALHRSKLWDPDSRVERSALPTAGEILSSIDAGFDGKSYDKGYPDHMKKTIY
ncbi:MAG: pyridoxamine 5'-phosphate oxidase family protein [Pseudomonadota bacterium]